MTLKVQILFPCESCQGEAYVPIGEADDYLGQIYLRYQPCPACQGSGYQTRWIALQAFADLLERAASQDPMEPDDLELARQQPMTQYLDSCEAAGF